ncbi:Snf7-domain-containing protein [Morchella snyderi]|nr:Snf7-domain-containing protein [Morchella snyderi]
MGNNSSSHRVTAQDRAILDMKIQRDKLRQYQKKIQTVLDREHEIAKEMLAKGDKQRALLALRKRKYQEQLLIKTDGQLQALEELTSTIEFTLVQKSVLYGLRQGNQVLKEIHKEMSLESVEKLMEETADGIAYQREISNMLAGRMSNEEEDEVEDELEQMEREERAKSMAAQMPNAPTTTPVATTKEQEEGEEEETEAQRRARRAKERARERREELAAGPVPMLA